MKASLSLGSNERERDAYLARMSPHPLRSLQQPVRLTGRWRDDKSAEDATTTSELIDLYRTAQRKPASS